MPKISTLLAAGILFMAQFAFAADSININTASAQELAAGLTGVGQARAEAIVHYRETHGDFVTLEELTAVRGIGQSVLEKNRDVIVLSD